LTSDPHHVRVPRFVVIEMQANIAALLGIDDA
jgi:hypothetical protein